MKVVRESVIVFTRECTVRENLNKNERPIQGVTRLFGQVIRRWINTPSRSRQNEAAATETIDGSLFTRWLRRRAPKLQPAFAHRPLQSIRLEERRLLSVTAGVAGNMLLISSDGLGDVNETVNVNVDYMTGKLTLTDDLFNPIEIDMQPDVDLTSITNGIQFDLGDGNDVINFEVIQDLSISVSDDAGVGAGTDTVNITGLNTITGDSLTIDAESISLAGDILLTNDFMVTGDTTLSMSTTLTSVNGSINFQGDLDGDAGTETLMIDAAGAVTVSGSITDVSSLTIDTDASISLNSLTLSTDDGTLDLMAGTSVNISGTISGYQTIDVDATTTVDFLSSVSNASTGAGSHLNVAGSDVFFASSIDQFETVSIDAGTEVDFHGNLANVGFFELVGAGDTRFSGTNPQTVAATDLDIQNTLIVDQNLQFDITNEASFTDIQATLVDSRNLTINAAEIGIQSLTGLNSIVLSAVAVGPTDGNINVTGDTTNINALSSSATREINFGGTITGTDNGQFAITAATDVHLNQNSGSLTGFTSVAVTASGVTRFTGDVTTSGSFTTDAAGSTQFDAVSLDVGSADFADNVVIATSLTIDADTNVDFGGSLTGQDGTQSLNLASVADATFTGAVSGLSSITITSTGDVDFQNTVTGTAAGQLDIVSAQNVTFADTLTTFALVDITNSTSLRFSGDVSGLDVLSVEGAGTLFFNTANVTVDAFDLTNDVVLEQSLQLSVMGDVNFLGSIDSDADMNQETLTIVDADNLTFTGGLSNLDGLNATATNDITFPAEITGIESLTLNAGNAISFTESITGTGAAAALLVSAASTVQFSGSTNQISDFGSVTVTSSTSTTFEQSFSNVAALTTNGTGTATFDLASLSVTTVTLNTAAEFDQTVTFSGTGDLTFNGTVSGSVADLNFSITNADNVSFGGAVSSFDQFDITSVTSLQIDQSVNVETILLESELITINNAIEATVGTLEFTAGDIDFGVSGQATANAGLVIQSNDLTSTIGLGGDAGDAVVGSLHLTEAELQALASTSTLTIGGATHTGNVNFYAMDLSAEQFDVIVMAAAGSTVSIIEQVTLGENSFTIDPPTDVVISAPMIVTGTATIDIEALNDITFNMTGRLESETGQITLIAGRDIIFEQTVTNALTTVSGILRLESDHDADMDGEILINATSTFTTGAGVGSIEFAGDVISTVMTPGALTLVAGTGDIDFNQTVSNLGGIEVTSANDVTFNMTVDQIGGTTINASGLTQFLANATNLGDLSIGGGGTTELTLTQLSADQMIFNDDVTFLTTASVTAGEDIAWNGTLSGAVGLPDLTVSAATGIVLGGQISSFGLLSLETTAGSIAFQGDVSSVTTLLSKSATTIDTGNITAGTITFEDTVTIATASTIEATVGALIFNSTITSSNASTDDLTLIGDTVELHGSIDLLQSLDVTGTNGITLEAATITTADQILFNNAVTLLAATDLGSADIEFASTLAGAFGVTAAGETITFASTITDVTALQLTASTENRLEGSLVNVGSLTTIMNGGQTSIAGSNLEISSGLFGDAVVLETDVTIDGATSLQFAKTLSSTPAGFDLTVTNAGTVQFDDTITNLQDLMVTATGTTTFSGDVSISGTLDIDSDTGITIDTGNITAGIITFEDTVTIATASTIEATVGALIFNSTITSSNASTDDLTLIGDTVELHGSIDLLQSLDVTGTNGITLEAATITTADQILFNNAVTLLAATDLGSADIEFASTLAGAFGVTADGETITFANTITDVTALDLTATTEIRLEGSLSNVGTLTTSGTTSLAATTLDVDSANFGGAVVLENNVSITGSSAMDEITLLRFQGTLSSLAPDKFNLSVMNAIDVQFDGEITNLNNLEIDASDTTTFSDQVDLSGLFQVASTGGITFNAAAPTTVNANAIDFQNAVKLDNDIDFTATNSIDFDDTLMGDAAITVTIDAGQDLTLTGMVSDFLSLELTADGTTHLDGNIATDGTLIVTANGVTSVSATSIDVADLDIRNGVSFTQSLMMTVDNQLRLGSTVTGTGATTLTTVADDLIVVGTISTFDELHLTGNSTASFSGDISGVTLLDLTSAAASFTVDSISATTISIDAPVTFNNPGDGTIEITATDATFQQSIMGTGAETLTITASMETRFGDDVSNLTSLETDSAGTTVIEQSQWTDITTVLFNDAVVLEGNVTFDNADSLTFVSTLWGNSATDTLTILNGDTVAFQDAVSDLASLDVSANQTILFNSTVTNVDDLTVSAGTLTTLRFSNLILDDASFAGPVQLDQSLVIQATNDVTFTGEVTGLTGLEELNITADTISLANVSDIDILTLDAATAIAFNGTLNVNELSLVTVDYTFGGTLTVNNGVLTITAETIEIDTAATFTANAGIMLIPLDAASTIGLGGITGDLAPGQFNLSEAELQALSSTGVLTIGRADLSGDITFHTADLSMEQYDLTILAGAGSDLSILQSLQFGDNNFLIDPPDNINIAAAVSATGAGTIMMEANQEIAFTADGSITTEDGVISLIAGTQFRFAQNNAGVLTTQGGSIVLDSPSTLINADSIFTTDTGIGSISITGAISSGSMNLFDLTLTAGTGDVSVTGSVDSLDEFLITSANDVTFSDTINDLTLLDVTASGTLLFQGDLGDVTDVTTLTIGSTGTTRIESDVINVGDATFGNSVTIVPSLNVTATGNVNFVGPVAGDTMSASLDVMAGGDIDFDSTIGTLTNLNLNVAAGQSITLGGDVTNVTNLTIEAEGQTNFETALISVGTASFGNPLFVEQSASIVATGLVSFLVSAPADVSIDSTMSSTLLINANSVQVAGKIQNLSSLTVTAPGETRFTGDISSVGTLLTNGGGNTLFTNSNVSVTTATFTDDVQLDTDVTMSATGDINFNGSLNGVDGDESLVISTSQNTTFAGTIDDLMTLNVTATDNVRIEQNVNNVDQLIVDSGMTTQIAAASISVGSADFTGDVSVENDLTLNSDTTVTFNNNLAGTGGDDVLLIDANGAVQFTGTVQTFEELNIDTPAVTRFEDDISAVDSLKTIGGGTTQFNMLNVKVGTAQFSDSVEIEQVVTFDGDGLLSFEAAVSGNAATSELEITNTDDVTFGSTVMSLLRLEIDATGTTTFDGQVTDIGQLIIAGNGTTSIETDLIDVGSASFGNVVSVMETTQLNTATSAEFLNTVAGLDGNQEFNIDAGTNVTFADTVSNLAKLDITAAGMVTFATDISDVTMLRTDADDGTFFNVDLMDVDQITVGSALFVQAVTINQDTSFIATDSIEFQSTLTGDPDTVALSLKAEDTITFGGLVSGFGMLTIDAGVTTQLNANMTNVDTLLIENRGITNLNTAMISVGSATFQNPVIVQANLTLNATADVDFQGTVTADGMGVDLVIGSDTNVLFEDEVSDFNSLQVTSMGTTTFKQNLNSIGKLNVTSSAMSGTIFGTATVGELTADVTMATFTGNVTLLQDVRFTANSSLLFNNNLSGSAGTESLFVESNTGSVDFAGSVMNLTDLTIDSAQNVTFQSPVDLSGDLMITQGTGLTEIQDQFSAGSIFVDTNQINILGDVSTDTGSINLSADDFILIDATLDTTSAGAAGDVVLNATEQIHLTSNGEIFSQSTGEVRLTSDAGGMGANGNILLDDGSTIQSTSVVILEAAQDIVVSNVVANNSFDNAIQVTSRMGGVVDSGDIDREFVTDGRLVIQAADGIGTGDALEIDVNQIDITNTANEISVSNSGALEIVSIVQNANGATTIVTESGVQTVLETGTGITSLSGLVMLDAQGTGSLLIQQAITTNGGELQLLADTGITTEADGSLNTTGAVGANSGDVTLDVRGTGNVTLNQSITSSGSDNAGGAGGDAGQVTVTTADGRVDLGLILTNGGDGSTTAGNGGDVSVTATGGSINLFQQVNTLAGTMGAGGVDGNVQFTTTDSILDSNDGQTKINAGNAFFSAVNAIGEIDSFELATGNAIDLQLTGTLERAEVTADGGSIHLKHMGDLLIGSTSLIPDVDGAADLVISSTGRIDIGTNIGALVTSTGDRVHLVSETTLVLPDAGIDVGNGQLRLTGTDDIIDPAGRELGLLRAQDLFVVTGAAGGDTTLLTDVATIDAEVTGAGQALNVIEADGIIINQIQTNNGNVSIEAATFSMGDITVVDLNAGDALVELTAAAMGGGVIDGGSGNASIQAGSLVIDVTEGVGDNDRLIVDIDELAVATQSGDINILDLSGGLTITDIQAVSGVSINNGSPADQIDIRSNGDFTITSDVVNTGGGNIQLSAIGTDPNSLKLNARVAAENGTGNVLLTATEDIELQAMAIVETDQTGEILISAGENQEIAGAVDGVDAAEILMNGTAQILSDAGEISLRASGDVTIATINANSDGLGDQGDITIEADFAGIQGTLAKGSGAILESAVETVTNLTGESLTLLASTGIGSTDDLQTNVTDVVATNTVSGNIRLFEVEGTGDNSLIINSVSNQQGTINLQTEDGTLQIDGSVTTTDAGAIQLIAGDGDNDGNGNLILSADVTSATGQIRLESAGNDIVMNNDSDVSTTTGNIVVQSGVSGNGVVNMVDGTSISTTSGTIGITAFGNVSIGQLQTGSTSSSAISINTTAAVTDSGDLDGSDLIAESGRVVIQSANGIGSGNALETSVQRIDFTNTTSGNIEISETTTLNINRIDQQSAGDVMISSTGTVTATTPGSGISLAGGDLSITTSDTGSQLLLNSSVNTNGGDVGLNVANSLRLGSMVELNTSGGDLLISAGMVDASGQIVMNATSMIEAGNGFVSLNGTSNIDVAQIQTTDDLVLSSQNGQIRNIIGDATVNLRADQLSLSAAQGIGSSTALQTSVNLIAAENSTGGAVQIENQSGAELMIGSFSGVSGISNQGAGGGRIAVSNNASMTVNAPVVNLSGGEISLAAAPNNATSDLTVNGAIFAAGAGAIELRAGHDLLLNDAGVMFDVFGGSVTGFAGNEVTIDQDVIVRSATGSVVQDLPLLENIFTPQVMATGAASVSGDFGRFFEQNYTIFVDWADGTIDSNFEGNPTPDSFTYNHTYFGNPNPNNPAAPIPITVTIIDDPNITFFEAGVEVLLPSITSLADVPGEGLASGIAFDLKVEVPELGTVSSSSTEVVITERTETIQDQDTTENVQVVEEVVTLQERLVKLRIFNAAGEVTEEITLEGEQALMILNDFVGFVEKYDLPDGRYQILQQEPGETTLRVVYDLLLRNGRPADNSDGLQDRPPTADEMMPSDQPAENGDSELMLPKDVLIPEGSIQPEQEPEPESPSTLSVP